MSPRHSHVLPRLSPTLLASLLLALGLPTSSLLQAADSPKMPALFSGKASELEPLRLLFAEAPSFSFRQSWQPKADAGFQPGEVRLRWTSEALWILAEMEDDYAVSRGQGLNDKLWELGDVFEVFVRMEDGDRYHEYHVAPSQAVMQLAFPVGITRKERSKVESFFQTPRQIDSACWVLEDQGKWSAFVRIPAQVLKGSSFERGDRLSLSFCRYDYAEDGEVIYSSTSPYRELNFHVLEDWLSWELE